MSAESITLSFVDTELSTANQLAGELHDLLLEELDATSVRRARTDELNQDFGAMLVLAGAVLATPAATNLARGMSRWLARRQDVRLRIKHTVPGGEGREVVVYGHMRDRQVEQVIREFFSE